MDTKTLGVINIDGINDVQEIFHNLSYDELYKHETSDSLQGYEKGRVTSSGTVAVDTGKFTGRSAKDKYIVKDATTENTVWWEEDGSTSKPMNQDTWSHLRKIMYHSTIWKETICYGWILWSK